MTDPQRLQDSSALVSICPFLLVVATTLSNLHGELWKILGGKSVCSSLVALQRHWEYTLMS